MRETIDGTVYDTSTASKIAYWDNDLPTESGRDITEILYRTPSGRYFLYGAGGCFTKYKQVDRFGSTHGEKIVPMPFAEAASWGREHLLSSEYKYAFDYAPDGDGIDFRLYPEILSDLDAVAASKGTTRTQALYACIRDAAAKAKAEEVPPYRKIELEDEGLHHSCLANVCRRLKKSLR